MASLKKLFVNQSFEQIKDLVTQEPYNLRVFESKLHPNLFGLRYDQIHSPMSLPEIREARGIIFEKDTLRIVCYPFRKFFNLHESSHADPIDWKSATVQEKLDGSIIKIYHYNNEWIVATNNTIDARESNREGENSSFNYQDLFDDAAKCTFGDGFPFEQLDKRYTYIFEMLHLVSRIIVKYPGPRLVHIGTRWVHGFEDSGKEYPELNVKIPGTPQPRIFHLGSVEEVVQMSKELVNPIVEGEGFVVVDSNFHRIKVKSPTYVLVHSAKSSQTSYTELICRVVLTNEQDEFLSLFPEFAADHAKAHQHFLKTIEEYLEMARLICQIQHDDMRQMKKERANLGKQLTKDTLLFGCLMKLENNAGDDIRSIEDIFRKRVDEQLERTLVSLIQELIFLLMANLMMKIDKL